MIRARVSITWMLIVVLIAGLDCGLVRLFLSQDRGLEGALAYYLAVSAGVVGWLIGRGRLRRFSVGFTLTALMSAGVFYVVMISFPRETDRYLTTYERAAIRRLPASLLPRVTAVTVVVGPTNTIVPTNMNVEVVSMVEFLLAVEVVKCLPALIASLIGGLLALAFRQHESSNPAPHPILI